MEEMSLIIAVDVPYEVEITATGIPIHQSKVEFCIPKNDVSFNFPAKMVTDNKFVFVLTGILDKFMNETHDYKLYVYYGNARFEADSGSFNLVNKAAFEVKMQGDKDNESMAAKLLAKTKPQSTRKKDDPKTANPEVTVTEEPKATEVAKPEVVEPEITETPEVTVAKKKAARKISLKATKPTPTPTITATTTLKEAKKALSSYIVKEPIPKEKVVIEDITNIQDDPNEKVRSILSSMNKTATPSIDLAPVPVAKVGVTETQEPGKFFEEVNKMRKLNEQRKANRKIKDVIRNAKKK